MSSDLIQKLEKMASLVASSLDSAQASLDALYHLHDHTFSVGKKTKVNRMNELISEIETHLVAAGFATQLRIRSATDKAAANADALEAGPTAATAASRSTTENTGSTITLTTTIIITTITIIITNIAIVILMTTSK